MRLCCCPMQAKEAYMVCLKERGNQAEGCRSLAKLYLECRMERCGCQALHRFLLQDCHTRPSQHLAPYSTSVSLFTHS